MRARIGAIGIILALAPTAALANVLPFDGAYGNAEGCALYSHGIIPNGQGEFFLITPNTFSSYPVICDFRSAADSGAAGIVVNAVCAAADGEHDIENIFIIKHADGEYGLKPQGADEAGPWPACPPKDRGVPGVVPIN